MKKTSTDRKMRGLYAALLALALLAFALTNACARLADERFGLSLDMTESSLYALSDTTAEVCALLEEPVTIHVVSAREDYPAMLSEMLRRYARLSDRLEVAYVDPYENPVFLEYYAQLGVSLGQGDLLVEGAQRSTVVTYDEILLTDSSGAVTGIDLEQRLSSALLYVNQADAPQALMLTGHNERPTTALRRLFESNHFGLADAALLTGGVPTAEIVVIAAPTQDYAPAEIDKLEAYLSAGGRLMVFLEPSAYALPNLEALLKAWGIEMQQDLVFEPSACASGNPLNLIPMYAGHEVNAYFADHPVYVVMPSARSMALSAGAEAVLYSTGDAYRKDSVQYATARQEAGDVTGRAVLAALAGRKLPDGQQAMIFAAGSRMIYADDLMGASTYANSLFLSQVIGYLAGDHAALSIPPKSMSASPLPITHTQSMIIGGVLVVAVPLAVLAAGLITTYRRKRL